MSKIFLRHTLTKKLLTLLTSLSLYISLYENASLIIVSAETEYISTRSWYRNINFLRDRIRRIFYSPGPVACFSDEDDVSGNCMTYYLLFALRTILYSTCNTTPVHSDVIYIIVKAIII